MGICVLGIRIWRKRIERIFDFLRCTAATQVVLGLPCRRVFMIRGWYVEDFRRLN